MQVIFKLSNFENLLRNTKIAKTFLVREFEKNSNQFYICNKNVNKCYCFYFHK